MKKIIINTIAKIIKRKPINIKLNLGLGKDENWDSLAHITIYIELKKKFKYNGNLKNLGKVKTVKDWINFFSKKK
tara:strand:+ start:2321 stop:2545 length:225 start_codon:yes stop_codon:yes gene_type:complete